MSEYLKNMISNHKLLYDICSKYNFQIFILNQNENKNNIEINNFNKNTESDFDINKFEDLFLKNEYLLVEGIKYFILKGIESNFNIKEINFNNFRLFNPTDLPIIVTFSENPDVNRIDCIYTKYRETLPVRKTYPFLFDRRNEFLKFLNNNQRKVLNHIFDTTIHISYPMFLNVLITNIKSLIRKHISKGITLVWRPIKSYGWVTLLAWPWLRKIVNKVIETEEFFLTCCGSTETYLWVDDCSYSGTQLSQDIDLDKVNYSLELLIPYMNVNSIAFKKIEKNPNISLCEHFISLYSSESLFLQKYSKEEFDWEPFSTFADVVSIYFDHKIASNNSTYQYFYVFGLETFYFPELTSTRTLIGGCEEIYDGLSIEERNKIIDISYNDGSQDIKFALGDKMCPLPPYHNIIYD